MTPQISKAGVEAGYTYVSVLLLILVMTLGAQAAIVPSQSERIVDREAELLFRGQAYRDAIQSYWLAGGDNPSYPRELSDLLRDPRFEDRRHIRRLYTDPVAGGQWQVLRRDDDTIEGVRSRSSLKPRQAVFHADEFETFGQAKRYSDWVFRFEPETD